MYTFMKKINFKFILLLMFLLGTASFQFASSNVSYTEDEAGNITFDDDFDDDFFGADDDDDFEIEPTFRIPSITETDLWRKVGGTRTRDFLFLPITKRSILDADGIDLHIVYNHSKKLDAAPNVSISDKAIDLLTGVGGSVDGLATTLKLLPFVRKMTIWEHRLGIPIQVGKTWGRWAAQLETSLLTCARHFWLNQKDQETIKKILEESATESNLSPPKVYRLTAGLGDTKIKFGYNVVDSQWVKTNFGISGIIPTSHLGIGGKPKPLVTAKPGDQRTELYQNLLNSAPKIMLQPKLGTGHWGIGTYMDMKINMIPNQLDFWSRISIDYLLPGNESRYMPSNRLAQVSDLVDLHSSETIPDDFPIHDYFPYLASAYVNPGSIFNATIGFDWHHNNWKFTGGYDFYAQQAEKITKIRSFEIDPSFLHPEDITASQIVQHKIFANIDYVKKQKRHDIIFGIGGDLSVSSKGAARDWSVFGKIGITF